MSTCPTCNAPLEGAEKFCGACGQPIAKDPAGPAASLPPTAETAAPEMQGGSRSESHPPGARQKSSLLLPALVIGVLLVGGAYYVTSQPSGPTNPTTVEPAAVAAPLQAEQAQPVPVPTPTTAEPAAAIAPAPKSVLSEAQAAFAAETAKTYADAGIAAIAPLRLTLPGCATCQPSLIYCVEPLETTSQMQGRNVRATLAAVEAHALIEASGGILTPMPFSELRVALETGVIDCAISGGGPLQ